MKDKLSAFWSGFKDKWSSLAKNLRIFIITAVSVVIVAAIVLAIVLNQKGYTAIYIIPDLTARKARRSFRQ